MTIAPTLAACLEQAGIQPEIVTHPHTPSASRTAQASHVSGDRVAKAVLLKDETGYLLAVLPASHHLNLEAVEEVVRLTGITDEQLRGQKLDEHAVTTLAAPANLIIAHNAAFDRCFLERRLPLFVDKPWACSMGQVPWAEEGLGSAKLDYLLSQFGFFFDDHRALADCRAVLHLLSLSLPRSGRPILPLLLANARRHAFRIWALEAPIDCKDVLKERGYRWNSGADGRPRAWFRDLDGDLIVEEELFLADKIYGGACRHELIRIDYSNRFSDRV